jgi:hypothetical protein
MPADPRDDFGVFTGHEHMFFGIRDPFRMIRDETVSMVRRQVEDTEVDSIVCAGEPKYLTLGRKLDDGAQVVVTWFGFCVHARVALHYDGGRQRDELPSVLTFLFGRVDEPGQEVSRVHLDVHADAERGFTDDVFHQRFLAFRNEPPTSS